MSPGVPCAEAAAAAAVVEHRQCVAEKTQQRQSNRAARSEVRGDVQGATHTGAGLAVLNLSQRWCIVCS